MNRSRMLGALAGSAIALAGCGQHEAKWTAEAAQYAVYATRIPLYPGAKVEDAMGNETYGDAPGEAWEGMTWWYKTPAPKDKLIAWYDQKLTSARREVTDEGYVKYTLTPPSAEEGEEMGVLITNDGFRVFEDTKMGKHKS